MAFKSKASFMLVAAVIVTAGCTKTPSNYETFANVYSLMNKESSTLTVL